MTSPLGAGLVDFDRRRLLCHLSGAVTAIAAAAVGPVLASSSSVLPTLHRGINLSHWFELDQGQAVSAAEMLALRQLGMDHVRIPVDPVVGGWRPEAGARIRFLPALRSAIEQALAAGLNVVIDLHLDAATKQQIEDNSVAENALLTLWQQLARDFSDLPLARVAFELLNEPQYYGWRTSRRWPALQQRLLQALREQAPRHLALLSGNEGGSLKGLLQLPLIPDPAVAYVFHYYEPFLFTHQGAEWLDSQKTTAGLYRGVRYPSQFQVVSPARLSRPHPRAAQDIASYLKEDWGPLRIQSDIEAAGEWAKRHGVRVLCNEFGAIRANVDVASRYRWMTDVRRALELNGLGWTLWDYTDNFGITSESAQLNKVGKRALEPEAVRALALGSGNGFR